MTTVFDDIGAALEEADYLAVRENCPYALIAHGEGIKVVLLKNVDYVNNRILEIIRPKGGKDGV